MAACDWHSALFRPTERWPAACNQHAYDSRCPRPSSCSALIQFSMIGRAQTPRTASAGRGARVLDWSRLVRNRYCAACHGSGRTRYRSGLCHAQDAPGGSDNARTAQRRIISATAYRLVRRGDGQATPGARNQRHAGMGEHVSRPRVVRREGERPPGQSRRIRRISATFTGLVTADLRRWGHERCSTVSNLLRQLPW